MSKSQVNFNSALTAYLKKGTDNSAWDSTIRMNSSVPNNEGAGTDARKDLATLKTKLEKEFEKFPEKEREEVLKKAFQNPVIVIESNSQTQDNILLDKRPYREPLAIDLTHDALDKVIAAEVAEAAGGAEVSGVIDISTELDKLKNNKDSGALLGATGKSGETLKAKIDSYLDKTDTIRPRHKPGMKANLQACSNKKSVKPPTIKERINGLVAQAKTAHPKEKGAINEKLLNALLKAKPEDLSKESGEFLKKHKTHLVSAYKGEMKGKVAAQIDDKDSAFHVVMEMRQKINSQNVGKKDTTTQGKFRKLSGADKRSPKEPEAAEKSGQKSGASKRPGSFNRAQGNATDVAQQSKGKSLGSTDEPKQNFDNQCGMQQGPN